MGMQLNIKDEKLIEDAKALALRLGKTVTATMRDAIAEKAAREMAHSRKVDVQALLAEARSLRERWVPEVRDLDLSIAHGDLLYDDGGAPK